jgi:hypothetical protein
MREPLQYRQCRNVPWLQKMPGARAIDCATTTYCRRGGARLDRAYPMFGVPRADAGGRNQAQLQAPAMFQPSPRRGAAVIQWG